MTPSTKLWHEANQSHPDGSDAERASRIARNCYPAEVAGQRLTHKRIPDPAEWSFPHAPGFSLDLCIV